MTGQQLEERPEEGLVPYQRGVALSDIAKGTLGRFLPGTLITMVGAAVLFDFSVSGSVLAVVGGFLGIAATLTAGFGLGLLGLRRWLYPDAKVGGRRSLVAGLLSPLALFIGATGGQGWTLTLLPVLLVLVGVMLALGMNFAWLSETPEGMRGEEFVGEPGRLVTTGENHS